MQELLSQIDLETALTAIGVIFTFQLITVLYMVITLRRAASERAKINRDTFGLLKKVEGLVARKQEKIAKEYDRLLEQMTLQVPISIAKEAGNEIFETEKYVLTRLAELEPELKDDGLAMQKMETIIKTMEGLESTVISATSKAVERVLIENRKDLFSDDSNDSQAVG